MPIRLRVTLLFFIAVFVALTAKLFYWQVFKAQVLSAEARNQYEGGFIIDADRGDIKSSDGGWLAASGEAWLVFANIPDIKRPKKEIAEKLAPLFVEDPDDKESVLKEIDRLETLMSREKAVWVALKHKVGPEVRKQIEEMNLEGIGFELEERRIYPEGSSSAHLLGFVGKDSEAKDTGYFGLEGYWNLALSGKEGYVKREKDAYGLPILLGLRSEVAAIKGVDLITHIDKGVQLLIEEKLKMGIEKYGAESGSVTLMDPKTGGILGMAAYPSFDPSKYWKYKDELFLNPVISSTFEPGSVFKVLVMAAGLDAGVVKPETICDICNGPVKVANYSIETWNQVYNPGSDMVDVIVNSDNVGMVFVSQKLGSERLYDYLSAFGIGQPTGIDLQGETGSYLRKKGDWSVVDTAVASFGQGIAVTPIQLLSAVSAIANKGYLMKPQVVDILDGGTWREDIKPEKVRQVISEKAASEITLMMVEAAKNGEAKWTHLKGYKVAGKTGTAQIPIAGHYSKEKTIASFIGFAPYDDPKFVMLVTLREPTSSPWASETAAPLWYSIAKDLFIHFKIQPEN